MPEVFITLEDAAVLEGIIYETIKKRVARNPQQYQAKQQPRESGGKDQVMVTLSSLSAKARRAYKAAQRAEVGGDAINVGPEAAPWYVTADLNQYIEEHRAAYLEAVELAGQVTDFLGCACTDRTAYAEGYAGRLGVGLTTFYRYTRNVLEGNAWALKLEREDGHSRDHFRALALCRKPKERATFPSLPEEQRAVIENIWFNRGFAENLCTKEMLYTAFRQEGQRQGWESAPSLKTVSRYIQHIMDTPGAESARYLAANGLRAWKNEKMLKCKRDTAALAVMEYVLADAHTMDFWVQYTAPNGKVKAVRPMLVAWIDVRSRCLMGDVFCVASNTQIVKETVVKMVYSSPGGVPQVMHMDNGKDFTSAEMLGQNRKERAMEPALMDSETKGFLLSIGVKEWSRSLPFQPWDKGEIERVFGTICSQFSKWFASYTGTLTGSTTAAKRHKDVNKMLERGELLTMEEAFEAWTQYKNEVYHKAIHRGLKDAGEPWLTPIEVFENAERYEKAAPPREYAAMLLMKADTALVTSQGITKFGQIYTNRDVLCHYNGQKVGIKWDIDDVTKLYVFDKNGKQVCEAVSLELMQFGSRASQESVENHKRDQNRQLREERELIARYTTPFEARFEDSGKHTAIGKMDLTIKAQRGPKVISIPTDKEYRGRTEKKAGAGDAFLAAKAEDAMARLRAINQ